MVKTSCPDFIVVLTLQFFNFKRPIFSHSEFGIYLTLIVSYDSCCDIVVIASAGMNLFIAIHTVTILVGLCALLPLGVEFNCCLKILPCRTYSIIRC